MAASFDGGAFFGPRPAATLRATALDARHSTAISRGPAELLWRTSAMSKGQRQTPRKPATKFAHLRKKMQQAKAQVKMPRKK
jgi:hypothetical protein